jgi:hypothetical protein
MRRRTRAAATAGAIALALTSTATAASATGPAASTAGGGCPRRTRERCDQDLKVGVGLPRHTVDQAPAVAVRVIVEQSSAPPLTRCQEWQILLPSVRQVP